MIPAHITTWPDVGLALVSQLPAIIAAVFAGFSVWYSRRSVQVTKVGNIKVDKVARVQRKAAAVVLKTATDQQEALAKIEEVHQAVNSGLKDEIVALKEQLTGAKADAEPAK